MLIIPLLLAITPPTFVAIDPPVHHGRTGSTTVKVPRLDGNIVIDGVLDEPQWKQAAVLTGFSQYTPVDGMPAADSTEVLVWYSATALHIGIRAMDKGGDVHATLATRDHIFNDDNVQVFLSTFNDGRQAMVFGVNPFGVQADGAMNENGLNNCGGPGCGGMTRQPPDLSQDFVWDSKGRLTPTGYEVEIRIPFKSIRFQAGKTQTWGINFLRTVQRSGQEQTWTAVKRGASSFLAQSGHLEGLTDLDAGHALDIVPTVTSRVTGAPPTGAPSAAWKYDFGRPQFGGDMRYGITPNLTLHATAHPDFSQVESDVTQFSFDPRQSVFYPEKRPFFLDGVEQFDAPASLIYTRRIVQPVFASKVTGKVGDNQVGVLAAVDQRGASNYGDNPLFGILRASHDLGPGSRLGALWTEQHDGPETNRVLDLDSRIVVNKVNSITVNGAYAHDDNNGIVNDAALWGAGYQLNGRNFRINSNVFGIGTNFITRAGFVGQRGVVNAAVDPGYTWLQHDKTLEALSFDIMVAGHWKYDAFMHGGEIQNKQLHFNANARLKGGWGIGAGYFVETFGYDADIYGDYGIRHPDGTVTPFTGGGVRLPNKDYAVNFNTPSWKHFDLNGFVLAGLNDENYSEWASGKIWFIFAGMNFRPTDQLRLNVSYNDSRVYRPSDGSRVLRQDVAVGTLEYQLSRAFQLRVISQYSINARDSLRDDSRTNLPIVIRDRDGVYQPTAAYSNRALQSNFLFTYLPNPGTVIYAGYGNIAQNPDLVGRGRLGPAQSDFFLKVSYLWRTRG